MSLGLTRRWIALLAASVTLLASVAVESLQGAPGWTSTSDYQGTAVIVASAALFAGLGPGDHVAFGLPATPDALLVVFLRRTPPPRHR